MSPSHCFSATTSPTVEAYLISKARTIKIHIRRGGKLFLPAGWHMPITTTELQPCNYSPLHFKGWPGAHVLPCLWGGYECNWHSVAGFTQGDNRWQNSGCSSRYTVWRHKLHSNFWKTAKEDLCLQTECPLSQFQSQRQVDLKLMEFLINW